LVALWLHFGQRAVECLESRSPWRRELAAANMPSTSAGLAD
jgi:hypothetical protein